MKKVISLIFSLFFCTAWAQNELCESLDQLDFKELDRLVEKKIKNLARDHSSFINNHQRLDSLENWFLSQSCVTDAYWNKNIVYTLITLTFTRQMGVKFITKKGVVERCYNVRTSRQMFGDVFYWRLGWDIPDRRLKYLTALPCDGFIKQHKDIDEQNVQNNKRNKHNYAVRFSSQMVKSDGKTFHGYNPKPEGEPLYVELRVQNFSDSLKKIVWPIHQNHGKKSVYFHLLDEKVRNTLLIEDRNVNLAHNETITYEIIELKPNESKTFVHVINGECLNSEYRIQCHHDLGMLQEGNYKLKVWYHPRLSELDKDVWRLMDLDSIAFSGVMDFSIERSWPYSRQIMNSQYKKDWNNYDKSEAVYEIKVLGKSFDYLHSKGSYSASAFGVVLKSLKGNSSVGDTIAFTIRAEDKMKLETKLVIGHKYRIYATHSNAHYYTILQASNPLYFMKGKRNYQLINYSEALEEL